MSKAETPVSWQPHLFGESIRLRPLVEKDFEALFEAAADPLIWEQHPDSKRYTRERFEVYFRSGIESKGALAVIDLKTHQIIGSSRFSDHNAQTSSVEVGFTFLPRKYWGGTTNFELKSLMLNYAFQCVDSAFFVVGSKNQRSCRAMKKIGGRQVTDVSATPVTGDLSQSVVFQIRKSEWSKKNSQISYIQPEIETSRLKLEAIGESHTQELWELFSDTDLHTFVPYEPLTLEKQRERCIKWSKRRSPNGNELWLNWAGRDRATNKVIAHFQAGVNLDVASVGYLVAKPFQNQGIASEGLNSIFNYLHNGLGVSEVKAWADTRNLASHRLAEKLGMKLIQTIENADFFKGTKSDEYVFSRVLP